MHRLTARASPAGLQAPARAPRRARAESEDETPSLPWPPRLAMIVMILMLIPVSVSLGGLVLTPVKTFYLFAAPYLLVQLLRGAYGQVVTADRLILAYLAWMTISMFVTHTAGVAIQYTGSNVLLILGGYLAARASIRTKQDFLGFIKLMTAIMLVALPFALYETLFDNPLVLRFLKMIPGLTVAREGMQEPRYGLYRVQFVFDHPIHFGLFCSMALSLVFVGLSKTLGWLPRMIRTGIASVCCFLSLSSGAVLAMGLQFGLFAWDWVTRNMRNRWRLFSILLAIGYTVLEISSNRWGLYALVERLSFNPMTAYVRKLLLEYGIAQIGRTPIFGVGFHPWELPSWMTGSMDNYWLLIAVVFGLPAFLFYAGGVVISLVRIGRRNFDSDPEMLALRRGWIFMMSSVCLSLFTVAVWGTMSSVIAFIFGTGIWMMTATAEGSTPAPGEETAAGARTKTRPGRRVARRAPPQGIPR